MLRKYYFHYGPTPVVAWIHVLTNVEECIDRGKSIPAYGSLGGSRTMNTKTVHFVETSDELKSLLDLRAESNG
jgi:hypothetical protein